MSVCVYVVLAGVKGVRSSGCEKQCRKEPLPLLIVRGETVSKTQRVESPRSECRSRRSNTYVHEPDYIYKPNPSNPILPTHPHKNNHPIRDQHCRSGGITLRCYLPHPTDFNGGDPVTISAFLALALHGSQACTFRIRKDTNSPSILRCVQIHANGSWLVARSS